MEITQFIHGYTSKGEAIISYILTNQSGAWVKLSNIGANIIGIGVPDKDGVIQDVVAGYKDINQYFNDSPYLGKTVGQFANRINKGKFSLNGKDYQLAVNNGVNHLHGGPQSMCVQAWVCRVEDNDSAISFTYFSPDGEENYPGNVQVTATFAWSEDNVLTLDLRAVTDKETIINLTNHCYFNLAGEGNGTILNHLLQLHAREYLPIDSTSIPLGKPSPVEGTPFDFRQPKPIGQDIEQDNEQLRHGTGYDHCWCLDGWENEVETEGKKARKLSVRPVAVLKDPVSGRTLTMSTDQPGIQVYSGNWLAGNGADKHGNPPQNRSAVALECQNFPDAPNHPHEYPCCYLRPGETFHRQISWAFTC